MMILAVMGPGAAFLVMIGVLIIFIVGLIASGIVKIHIEVVDEEDEEIDLEEIKALDDSTFANRLLKWLAKIYEKLLEREKAKNKDKKD